MDFLDPKYRRAQDRRLMLGYVLVAVVVALVALVVLFQAYGFSVDRKTGQVIQNGLVFVDAHPESANIYLNGELNRATTNARLTIPAGHYTIELKRDGYRTWKRTIYLEGGSVEQLVYPVLFPVNLVRSDENLYAKRPVFATQSPDRRWLLVLKPGSSNAFDSYDLNAPQNDPTPIVLPASSITKSSVNSYQLVEWSTDNRHVLLKHLFKGGSEFVIVDRTEPNSSFNVDATIGSKPSRVTLRNKRFDQLYVYFSKSQKLETYNVTTRAAAPFLTKVTDYKTFGADKVMYVTNSGVSKGKVALMLMDGSSKYTMMLKPSGTKFLLDMAQFSGDWYMVVYPSGEGRTYVFKNPQDRAGQNGGTLPVAETSLVGIPDYISFSANTRFIAAQKGNKFAVYDIETNRRFYFTLKDHQVSTGNKALWMDGHRLALVVKGNTVVFDFDGSNTQVLSPSLDNFTPYFDPSYLGMYNVAPSVVVPGRYALVRTELKVKR